MTLLKQIRKGAYEGAGFLVLHVRWISEKWDGPREAYRGWQVFKAGSTIQGRVLLDSFRTCAEAHRFVESQQQLSRGTLPKN